MPNKIKEQMIAEITEAVEKSNIIWVVDYRGLTVKQTEALRGQIRANEASLKVYKNTLVKRVLAEKGLPTLDDVLAGPSAFVFASGDPVASAKALKTFAQTNKQLVMKGGILDGAQMSAEQVKAIADLPSREELLAKLLGTLNNPATKFVRVLNEIPASFVRTLGAIADKKSAA